MFPPEGCREQAQGMDRLAQVVAGGGKKARLCLVGLFRLAARLVQLAHRLFKGVHQVLVFEAQRQGFDHLLVHRPADIHQHKEIEDKQDCHGQMAFRTVHQETQGQEPKRRGDSHADRHQPR